jgi:hypothetical protein
MWARIVNDIIENYNEGQFANGQISRDLRAKSDAVEPHRQVEALNAIGHCSDEPSAAENWEYERRQHGSQFLPRRIDADEQLPGHLREPHLPRFESARFRKQRVPEEGDSALRAESVADKCG